MFTPADVFFVTVPERHPACLALCRAISGSASESGQRAAQGWLVTWLHGVLQSLSSSAPQRVRAIHSLASLLVTTLPQWSQSPVPTMHHPEKQPLPENLCSSQTALMP